MKQKDLKLNYSILHLQPEPVLPPFLGGKILIFRSKLQFLKSLTPIQFINFLRGSLDLEIGSTNIFGLARGEGFHIWQKLKSGHFSP